MLIGAGKNFQNGIWLKKNSSRILLKQQKKQILQFVKFNFYVLRILSCVVFSSGFHFMK